MSVGELVEEWVLSSPKTPEGLLNLIRSRIVMAEEVGKEKARGESGEDGI